MKSFSSSCSCLDRCWLWLSFLLLLFNSFYFLFSSFSNLLPSSLHLLLHFSDTLTLHIYSTTFIAKLKFTLASHVITSFILFNPKFTFRTLFKLLSFDKFHKGIIICTMSISNLKLFTCHIFMPFHSTIQTILLFTLKTFKSWIIIFLKEKHILTICCWTPRNRISMHICIVFKSMFLIFLVQIRS